MAATVPLSPRPDSPELPLDRRLQTLSGGERTRVCIVRLVVEARSILDNIRRLHPNASDKEAYALCARFAFRNRDANRLVGTLSGGERLRAMVAATLSGSAPPWLVILDEPTNHLDIEAVEVLEGALQSFDGALLVVSHDPSFVGRVGFDRFFEVCPPDSAKAVSHPDPEEDRQKTKPPGLRHRTQTLGSGWSASNPATSKLDPLEKVRSVNSRYRRRARNKVTILETT